MNIFYLDHNVKQCAAEHCDKHVVKMCIEYAQLLSTAHRVIDGDEWDGRSVNGRRIKRYFHPDPVMNEELYKACHVNHPSAIWTRASVENYVVVVAEEQSQPVVLVVPPPLQLWPPADGLRIHPLVLSLNSIFHCVLLSSDHRS